MSEELIQRNLIESPEKMGSWDYYSIGSTTLKALKGAKIIPNKDYDSYEPKKPDALIVKKPQVVAAVEYKQPKDLRTEKQINSAIEQEIGTAKALDVFVYIVTDGNKTFWINPKTGNRIKDEDGNEVSLSFRNNNDCIVLINRIMESVDSENDQILKPNEVDPLPLAKQVWQDLWSVSGATPENCLYTFVEVFIFKYLSDLGVLPGLYSFSNLIAQYSNNSEDEVLEYYASTVRTKVKELFPGNPKDKTTIINGTIFVSKDDKAVSGYATVFKRILLRFESFGTLQNIDYDFKSKLFEVFLKESISKKNWGQYFTPLKVVQAIVKMADIAPGMKICDPACGVGKFLLEPILSDLSRYYKFEDGKLIPQISLYGFDKGFDKDEQKTIILAKANMLIYLSNLIKDHPDMTQQFASLFNETFFLQTNSILGTLAQPTTEEYDLILTNPPYVMSGSSNLKEEISKRAELKTHYAVNGMGIEGLFIEWIIRALRPEGKAFVVVPDGLMNRSNDQRLRDFILEECQIDAVISLPLNTFFTTNKKTYILVFTKKPAVLKNGVLQKARQTSPVFTYLCSEIGETRDAYRFDIAQNDLYDAAILYNMFKGAKREFKTSDLRCKVLDIDVFYSEKNWSVDRWWSYSEKVALGLEDRFESVSLDNYTSLLDNAISVLAEINDELSEIGQLHDGSTPKMVYFPLKEILTPEKGKAKYTKKYGEQNKGEYPVFSASANRPLTHIETFDYEGTYLSWATNGFAGTTIVLNGKFSINGDRGILVPKRDDIDVVYLKYTLEPLFRELAKGRKGDRGQNEFTKLYPSMIEDVMVPLPIDETNSISLSMQKEIAQKHLDLSKHKETLAQHFDLLVKQDIDLY